MFVAGKFINIFSVRTVLAFCGIMPHTPESTCSFVMLVFVLHSNGDIYTS
jgi:hypothetical protein